MLRTCPISITQSLIDVTDDEFGESDCGKNKVRILLVSFTFKKSTGAAYPTSSAKRDN